MSTTSDDTEAPLLPFRENADEEKVGAPWPPRCSAAKYTLHPAFLLSLLSISFIANLILGSHVASSKAAENHTIVQFSDATTEIPFPPESDYGRITNMTLTDELWDSLAVYVNKGFVALPKEKADLPPSDPFPWDTTKEVFVLNSFHLLHCLNIIYKSFRDLQAGDLAQPMFAHTIHCLDALRQEVLCTADDTPYVLNGKLIEDNQASGITQMRQCRRWQELEDFAVANSACFHNYDDDDPRHLTIEEWVHCPPGSPYQATVNEFQGRSRS